MRASICSGGQQTYPLCHLSILCYQFLCFRVPKPFNIHCVSIPPSFFCGFLRPCLLECRVFFCTHLDPLVLLKTQPKSHFLQEAFSDLSPLNSLCLGSRTLITSVVAEHLCASALFLMIILSSPVMQFYSL